jgi:hypothetical protein
MFRIPSTILCSMRPRLPLRSSSTSGLLRFPDTAARSLDRADPDPLLRAGALLAEARALARTDLAKATRLFSLAVHAIAEFDDPEIYPAGLLSQLLARAHGLLAGALLKAGNPSEAEQAFLRAAAAAYLPTASDSLVKPTPPTPPADRRD